MNNSLKNDIGLRMRKLRKHLGLTQAQLVSYFDIGRANYSRIEKGEVFPNPNTLYVLRTQFNVSLDWLLADIGTMFVDENKALDRQHTIEISKHASEIRDLLQYMEKSAMVKHAVLAYFLEYKMKHRNVLDEQMGTEEQLAVSDGG